MCEPTTILTVASMVMGAVSSTQEAEYKAGVSEYNARVSENQAQRARNVATQNENIQRRKTAELMSKQRAQLGAAGVQLDSGSALQLQEDTRKLGEIDSMRIRTNADMQFNALQTQAELTRSEGQAARVAGFNKAAGSLLSSGAKLSSKWYQPDSAAVTQPLTVTEVTGTSDTGVAGLDNFDFLNGKK